jgi:hypothetical protein
MSLDLDLVARNLRRGLNWDGSKPSTQPATESEPYGWTDGKGNFVTSEHLGQLPKGCEQLFTIPLYAHPQPAIQQEPDEYQIRFCNSEGQFDSWKKCDKDFFYAHNDGKDDYAQTRVIYAHQQPAIQQEPDKAAELTDARLTGLLFTNYGYLPTDEAIPLFVRMMRTAIAADRALRNGEQQ